MNDERFHLLVEKHLEGILSDEEARELAGALERSAELRRRMLDEATLSGLLTRKHAEPPADLVQKIQAALRGAPDRSALVDKVLQKLPEKLPEKRPARVPSVKWLGALVAAAIIVVVGVVTFRRTPPPQPTGPAVAVLETASNAPIAAGQLLNVGPTDPQAVVVYEDGTRVVLRTGAARFLDEERIRLETGSLEAHVVAHKVIETPHGEAKGFGSEFSVLVEPGATRVSVDRGKIALTRAGDKSGIRISGGQYSVAATKDFDFPRVRPVVEPGKIDAAVRKAVAFLKEAETPSSGHYGPMSGHGLVALAMIHAGVDREDPDFRTHLEKMLGEPLQRTYVVAVQAMVLQALDPAKYRARLAECAQFLVDNQCANGQWSYGEKTLPPEGDRIVKRRDGEQKLANNSCSQIAALGIRACAQAGIRIPREIHVRAARWWAECQRPDKDTEFGKDRAGWCYTRDEKPHHPYASMTAGGIAAAVIADALQGKDWKGNPGIQSAVRWLGFHYSAHENYGPVEALMDRQFVSDTPQPRTEFYYYLWALERAGMLYGTELLGAHDWYAEGVEEVLAQQRPDGSWHAGVTRCQPVWDTCYAVLFLKRATRPLGVR